MKKLIRMRRIRAGLLPLAALLLPVVALGDIEATAKQELKDYDTELREPGYAHFGQGFLDRSLEGYDTFRNKVNERHGLDWEVAWSYLYQHSGRGGRNKWTNNSELDVIANWDLVQSEQFGNGSLTYVGLAESGTFVFHYGSKALPEIDGVPVELRPGFTFKSPFLSEDWDAGVVRIRKGNRQLTVDVNDPSTRGTGVE